MKKIVVSVGVITLGASAMQIACAQNMDIPKPAKPWTLSASLRGFYDDNPSTLPNGAADKKASFGYEVSPSASLVWSAETTALSLSYLYSFKYYDHRPVGNADHYDQTHTFNLSLDHAFNERYKIEVKDSFVIGQEPDVLSVRGPMATPYRIPGNNIRNYGSVILDGQITRELGFEVGYDNSFYDYADDAQLTDALGNIQASNAGTLNRLEHQGHLDARWTIQPTTIGVLGAKVRETDYTGDQLIGGNINAPPGDPMAPFKSDARNNRVYSPYVGVDHTFRPDLTGSLRVGADYADYYNDSNQSGNWSPYVMASLHYVYAPESYVEVGFTHDRNATDLVGFNANNVSSRFTVDSESSVVFATLNHRITPKLFGSINGQFQSSTFNGGLYDSQSEQYYLVGLDLEYRFTPNFSAHTGYNYDKLESDVAGRNYDRNRVYMGVTASY